MDRRAYAPVINAESGMTKHHDTVVVVSGHPAERGTFEFYLSTMEMEHLRDDPRFRDQSIRT